MNRIEFMTELAALLQDVPVVERQDAMKYYNDYFDDAGEENEQQVIEELESPAKVAATIKADLETQETGGQDGKYGEYGETGYKDTRFEDKAMPARRMGQGAGGGNQSAGNGRGADGAYWSAGNGGSADGTYRSAGGYQSAGNQEPPRTSPVLKVILIIAIILVGAPVIIPCAFAIIAVVFALVVAMFALFISLVVASIAVAVTGLVLFITGLMTLIPEIAVGFALIGTGLILGVLGVIGTVASIKLCIVVFPGICRGIVWLCRRPFQGKAVA